MFQLEIRNPVIPKKQITFALYNYRKLDMSVQSDRQKLIDSFVNSIYLYVDHFIITFHYKNTSKKVSLKEINSSSLTSLPPPIKTPPSGGCFYWWSRGESKGRPWRSQGKKHAGGMFLSPWENPSVSERSP